MTDREAMQQALEALNLPSLKTMQMLRQRDEAITALREGLEQQQAEPAPIYYMRDNHTFKKLSADVSTALVEIESEFNAGYTYGSVCSKRKGFPTVHAGGPEHRLVFFWECKTVLEKWTDAPPQRTPLSDFEARGIAAANLTFWHRLKEAEAAEIVKLFIDHAAPPQRKPLSDDMVHRAMTALNTASCGDLQPTFDEMRAALEAAHGIKGEA